MAAINTVNRATSRISTLCWRATPSISSSSPRLALCARDRWHRTDKISSVSSREISTSLPSPTTSDVCSRLPLRPRKSLRNIVAQHCRWNSQIGAEPGVNSSISSHHPGGVGDYATESEIRVIDFSDKHIERQEVSSASLQDFLRNPRPDWSTCRWIYVNGLNPNVVKSIGHAKGIHRLAIEDVLDTTTPAKVDWYEDHCFMEMPLQKVVRRGVEERRTTRPEANFRDAPQRRILSRDLAMSVGQVSIFLTADNTVITFFEHSGEDILNPILTRLEVPQTVVRSSNDPWMLIQAVIDAVVDLSLPIGKAVDNVFGELENAVLTSPAISQSRAVYVLRSGLTLLINNTNAISGLVRTLVDHRAITIPRAPDSMYISALAQVYLQDVQDHITTLSNNTHMSIRSAENLTSLIFNTIAASQNESVRQLTLISSFFLPLTFLTGYFGMNFDPMPVVNNHSDAFFWVIATPIIICSLALLGFRSAWYRMFIWRRRRAKLDSRTR